MPVNNVVYHACINKENNCQDQEKAIIMLEGYQ